MSPPTATVATAADWPEVVALRTRVFVEEQGVPPEVEQDDADAAALHAVARDATGRVVATGRLLERRGGRRSAGWRSRRGPAAAGTAPRCWPSCTAGRASAA